MINKWQPTYWKYQLDDKDRYIIITIELKPFIEQYQINCQYYAFWQPCIREVQQIIEPTFSTLQEAKQQAKKLIKIYHKIMRLKAFK